MVAANVPVMEGRAGAGAETPPSPFFGMRDTITGQGTLKVDGTPLTISFTVPKGTCGPESLLKDANALATQITDLAVAKVEQAGRTVSCAKGCGACCRQLVPISPTEARQLAAVVDAMPADQAVTIRAKFVQARATMAAAKLPPRGHPDTDKAAYHAFGMAWFRQGVACPFLKDESCSIHPVRPLVCREYLVTSPPAACANLGGGVDVVPIPIRVWAAFGKSAAPDSRLDWMPLSEALEFAATTPPPHDARTGPQRVAAFLQEIQA